MPRGTGTAQHSCSPMFPVLRRDRERPAAPILKGRREGRSHLFPMFPTYFVAHSRRAQRRSMQSMLPLLKLPPTGGNCPAITGGRCAMAILFSTPPSAAPSFRISTTSGDTNMDGGHHDPDETLHGFPPVRSCRVRFER